MVNMVVKYSEEKHLPQLVEMLEALKDSGLYSPKLLNGETLAEWMRRDDETYSRHVLTINNIAVGHVAVRNKYPVNGLVDGFLKTLTLPEGKTVHEIRRLFLHPDFHYKGYGKILLTVAEQEIIINNGIPLLTVKSNIPAVQFYEKHGWGTVEVLQDDIDSNVYWNAMFKNPETIIHYNPHLHLQ